MKQQGSASARNRRDGFTLIETLVYLALLAIFIGGAVVATYSIIEAAGHNQTRAMMQEEGDFLIAKINWALSGAQTVTSPPFDAVTPSQSGLLSVSKYGGANVTVTISGSDMQYHDVGGTNTLNNSNVQVSSLLFTHTASSGDGVDPESVKATFIVSAKTPAGAVLTQNFSTVDYLRR